jgi:di/tricarboxylate transporter
MIGMELWLTLAVLAGTVYLFVTEKLRVDVVALLALASLLVLGLVSPREALSGFSSQATITVAAMFVLSAGLQRSGALQGVGDLLAKIRWGWLLALVMMALVAFTSAFINNTAVVAVLLPMIIATTAARRLAPSKFLIPLSFASQFGGVCTLVGTSTNLLVDSLARQSGREGFTLFEFAPLGILFVGVGMVYLMLVRRFLLPDLGIPETETDGIGGRYLVELPVREDTPAVGRRGAQLLEDEDSDLQLMAIRRGGNLLSAPRDEAVRAGDRLLLRGDWHHVETARKKLKLRFDRVATVDDKDDGKDDGEALHAEVMVAPGSYLVGHTLSGLRFAHTYGAQVLGLQRRRSVLRQPIDKVPLAVGDVLMVEAGGESIETLRGNPGLVVLGERERQVVDRRRALLSTAVLASVILVAGLGWLPIVAAALLGCVALVVLRCLEPDEAYQAIDWRVVILLAGVLPLGIALQNSGGADWLARNAIGLVAQFGPVATLAVIYLLTAALTEVMSNNGAAVLVVPIAISAAESQGIDTKPLLVAVAFAASTSFATPVGYQTNTMVYAAGGYRFADFPKIGVPLNIIFWIMAIVLIPRYFPF